MLDRIHREEAERVENLQQHQNYHMLKAQERQRSEEERRWMQITMGPSPRSEGPGPGGDPGGAWSFGSTGFAGNSSVGEGGNGGGGGGGGMSSGNG